MAHLVLRLTFLTPDSPIRSQECASESQALPCSKEELSRSPAPGWEFPGEPAPSPSGAAGPSRPAQRLQDSEAEARGRAGSPLAGEDQAHFLLHFGNPFVTPDADGKGNTKQEVGIQSRRASVVLTTRVAAGSKAGRC